MGKVVPLDDIPDELLTPEEKAGRQASTPTQGQQPSDELYNPFAQKGPSIVPKGGVFGLPRGAEHLSSSPVGVLTNTEGGQSLLNGLIRGALRMPSNIVAGLPTLGMDVGQTLFGPPGKGGETSVFGGTPWEETLSQDDWAPAISTTAADKLFSEQGMNLYDRANPSGISRYAGSIGEVAGGAGPLGGMARLPGLFGTIGAGVGGQLGQDAYPNSKYAGPIGGLLGSLFGATTGAAAQPRPPNANPSWSSIQAAVDKETQDPNILYYTPKTQELANRQNKAKDIAKIRQMTDTAARDEALAEMITPTQPKGKGPVKFSLLTEVEKDHIFGRRNPLENAFWKAVDLAIKKTTGPMASTGLKMAKAAYDKAQQEPRIRTMLEQLDHVIRTQKRIPRSDPAGIAKNIIKTGIGQLDEEDR